MNKPVVMCGNLEKQAVKESSFEELCDLLDEEVDEKNMTKKELAQTKRRLSKKHSQYFQACISKIISNNLKISVY